MSSAKIQHLVNARLIDPESGYDGPGAVTLDGSSIQSVYKSTEVPADLAQKAAKLGSGPADASHEGIVDCRGLILAPGIVDMRVFVGEPGAQHRETFQTAGEAAAAGGVTTLVAQPDTDPVLDDPALVGFALSRARQVSKVNVACMGALTRGLEGTQMTEQRFLLDAGAVALTDGDHALSDAKLMRAALTYARASGALIVHHCQEPTLSKGASATSGTFAARLGLPSAPSIAERLMLERDLTLVESTGARYHADQITTGAALAPLRRAKEAGLKVSAGVSIHHLTLTEEDIADYRTFFKLTPPLRSKSDREAVLKALGEGVIDVIHSGHLPQDEETKRLPFEEAATGAVGLETILPAALSLVEKGVLDLVTLFQRLSLAPAQLLGLQGGRLAPGAQADLILFDPNDSFTLDREALLSRSKNTPFDRTEMKGRVIGTWVRGERVHEAA